MATKSILKTVEVKDNTLAQALYDALQETKTKKSKHVELSSPCVELRGELVKEFFKDTTNE